jgi:hypothetical protein
MGAIFKEAHIVENLLLLAMNAESMPIGYGQLKESLREPQKTLFILDFMAETLADLTAATFTVSKQPIDSTLYTMLSFMTET